jgi:two-component system, OmpR family, sensor histidine kinase VicK
MTQPQQPTDPKELGGMLKRVHQLGNATEALFSRLYGGLNRQKRLTEAAQQLEKMEIRTRHLRRALEEKSIETERLQAILANISEGIIMQDTEGRVIMMNEAAQQMLGNQRQFWSSELGVLFNAHRDLPTFNTELAPLGEAKRVEIANKLISAQIAAITDQENQRIGTMMILSDVTNENLASRMKDSFVTHISHELITPLTPLRVASEILLNTPEDEPANRKMLEMIGRNIDILDRMVTEMLDMSAMTSGEFQVKNEAVALEDVIWDILNSFEADVHDAQLEVFLMLKNTEQLQLTGDNKHLRWAISNLVRNAIQYNQAKQAIYLAVGIEHTMPEQIFVEVADTGVGISEEDLPNIFDLFYRGEARNQDGKRIDPRGLGQGLFVARTIARAHGGDLRVNSVPYRGSTFTMTLPRSNGRILSAG